MGWRACKLPYSQAEACRGGGIQAKYRVRWYRFCLVLIPIRVSSVRLLEHVWSAPPRAVILTEADGIRYLME